MTNNGMNRLDELGDQLEASVRREIGGARAGSPGTRLRGHPRRRATRVAVVVAAVGILVGTAVLLRPTRQSRHAIVQTASGQAVSVPLSKISDDVGRTDPDPADFANEVFAYLFQSKPGVEMTCTKPGPGHYLCSVTGGSAQPLLGDTNELLFVGPDKSAGGDCVATGSDRLEWDCTLIGPMLGRQPPN